MKEVMVVDKNDKIIGYKKRSDLSSEDIVRVSVLNIRDSIGRTLFSKRSLNKKNNPGEWGPAVAGMNEKGQNYIDSIKKETIEEIGHNLDNISILFKIRLKTNLNLITTFFETVVDKQENEFLIDRKEVDQVRRFSDEEIKKLTKETKNVFLKKIFKFVNIN